MNFDILASENYITVNRKLATLFGLAEAVYLAELCNICRKAFNKKSFNADTGEFKLDRKYICKQTTIKPDKQCEFDCKFQEQGILDINPENIDIIKMDLGKIIAIITCEDKKLLAAALPTVKQSAEEKKEIKRAAIIQKLKNAIKETDPEVKSALENWIEVVYDKGMVKTQQVSVFEEQLNAYSQDKSVKLAILKICIVQSYRVVDWGIKIYEKDRGSVRTTAQRQSTGLDKVNTF